MQREIKARDDCFLGGLATLAEKMADCYETDSNRPPTDFFYFFVAKTNDVNRVATTLREFYDDGKSECRMTAESKKSKTDIESEIQPGNPFTVCGARLVKNILAKVLRKFTNK
jgi:hypothetical protein